MGNKVRNETLINERKEERKKSKRNRNILIASVAGVVCVVIIIISVISKLPIKFKADGDLIVDSSTGIKYVVAPSSYAPRSYTQTLYGKGKDYGENYYIYPVTDMKASDYLARDYFGVFELLYREGLSLPTLSEFEGNRIQVCYDGSKIVRLADITNADEVDELLNIILNAETAEQPSEVDTDVYTLRITSPKYPWLYYKVNYIVYEDGFFFHDRMTDRFVEAGDIIDRYLNGVESETEDESSTVTGNITDSASSATDTEASK